MKSYLLPTDLSVASLYPIHEICKITNGEPCRIYLIHTLVKPSGIMDQLFLQEKKPYNKVPLYFSEAIEMLRKKYASVIQLLAFDFVWSNARPYLRNYMDARHIDAVWLLKNHAYKLKLPESINCHQQLEKCDVPVIYVEKSHTPEVGILTTLLYKEKMPA